MKLVLVLGCLVSVIALCQAGDFKVHIDIKDLLYDDKLMKLDVTTKRSDTKTTVNINGDIFNDIKDSIQAQFASYEKVDGKLVHFVNGTGSVCNVLNRFMSHPILKYILTELMKSSNIPMACPIKKGNYHIKEFTLNVDLLQPVLPQGVFLSIFRLTRVLSSGEVPLLSGQVEVDIVNPQDKKGFKLF